MILFSTYLSFSVFKNVSQENNEKISFPNHYNSIISEPFQRKEMTEYYDYSIYTNYDRYWTQEVINMVNEITDIKAVSMLDAGSNLAYLSMTSPLSNLSEEENNQRALKENEYIEEVFPFFTMPMYSLDDVYVRDDEVSNLMMSNIFYYSKNVDYYDSALPDDSLNRAISIYDLTNNYIPPLLAGHASNKNDEAIISQNFADLLLSEMHLHDYDELIGQSFRTGIFTSSNHADIQRQHREFRLQGLDESETRVRCYPQEINVKIAAVSSLNFEGNEFVVFFNSGLTNNLYFNALLSHKEKYRSNYVNVFIDPQSDTEKIADKMNQIMPPFFSRFIPYTQSMYQLDHYYRSSSSLLIYLVILNIIFLLGYLFVQLCNYRRSKKEANIFNHYHYDYLKITIFKNLLLMFIALCFFMVSVWLFFH